MSEVQQFPTLPSQPFRLDVPLHELLQQPSREAIPRAPALRQAALPTAVFPQHPELFHDLDEQDIAAHEAVLRTGKRHWPASKILKTMKGWMFPYFKSQVLPGDFQPIIAYLFTEWKCNLDCHYCWSYDNRVKGMSEDTARRAIDWLHTTPCRVLRSEEHTSELQSRLHLVCRLLLEKKNTDITLSYRFSGVGATTKNAQMIRALAALPHTSVDHALRTATLERGYHSYVMIVNSTLTS